VADDPIDAAILRSTVSLTSKGSYAGQLGTGHGVR